LRFVAAIAMLTVIAPKGQSSGNGRLPGEAKQRVVASYGKLPLHFEANQGQTDAEVKFLARGSGYGLFLTASESVLVLGKSEAARTGHAALGQAGTTKRSRPSAVLRLRLLGANPRPSVEGREELAGKSCYFIGSDPKKWRTNVPQYARVEYKDVYPGVSLAYYGNQSQLEYDFVVAPGGDPRQIRFGIEGAERIDVDAEGNLVLSLPDGKVVERAPVVYQEFDGTRQVVEGRFALKGRSEAGFDVGHYEADRPLVLDPLLVYSTYLGGSGADWGQSIAVDAGGNTYVAGYTYSVDFPTANPLQAANAGVNDVFVAKLNAAGSALVYSTYLGGSGGDSGTGVTVDESGNAFVTGVTNSSDFPTVNPLQPMKRAGVDAFVAKLNAAGSALLYSTYLGGNGDDQGNGIAVDAAGNAYVAGWTQSTNFPTTNPLQAANGGSQDAFVARLNPAGSALIYSTYLGGRWLDAAEGVAVDASGSAYVVGLTDCVSNFPTLNPLQSACGGPMDAFVTKLNPAGSSLVYSTYLGGGDSDQGTSIAVDASGSAYVAGRTSSTNFPTANPFQAAYGGGLEDAFVAKLDPAGSSLVFSTYLGGSDRDQAFGIAVDASGSAYLTGWAGPNFPTANPVQAVYGGGTFDAFVTKLDPSGSTLAYSTYLGGRGGGDTGIGIAVDSARNAYVVGITDSANFPTMNPVQAAYAGGFPDCFLARIGSLPAGDLNGDVKPDILWRNVATGSNAVWLMNGAVVSGAVALGPLSDPSWQIVGTADFSADGKPDILWRNSTTGANLVWFMNGTTLSGSAPLTSVADPNWRIVGTPDFNADGSPDILWRSAATGAIAAWFMNGTVVSSSALLAAASDLSWQIVGTADFNADGKPDILWRNSTTGGNAVLFMNGTMVMGAAALPSVSEPNWQIVGTADFNADGRPDILWRNTSTGADTLWFLNGTMVIGGAPLLPVGNADWRIVGPK
jgi:hypothetical protein